MPLFPEESIGDYVVPLTGETRRLPSAVADALGFQRAAPKTAAGLPTAPPQLPPDQQIDEWVNQKRASYERFGAAPEQIDAWTEYDRKKYSEFLRPPPQVARITQDTGPTGPIAQIGQPVQTPAQPAAGAGGVPLFSDEDMAALGQPRTAAEPAPAAPPAPRPTTEGDLKQIGIGGVLDEKQAALVDEATAITREAELNAEHQVKRAEILEGAQQQIDKRIEERAKDAEAMNARIESTMADYRTAVDKYASTKIDRSLDDPMVTVISLILSGAGAVMNKQSHVPALDMMMKQLDRKVQIQLAERDAMKDVAQMKRADIDILRQRATDRTAQYNLALAGEGEKYARQIEALAARSNSDAVKAEAAQLVAQLRGKSADHLGQGVMATIAREERDKAAAFEQQKFAEQQRAAREDERARRSQLGLGYSNLKLNRDQFDWQKKHQQDQLDLEAQKLAGKGNIENAKQARELGVPAPPVAVQDADGNVTVKREGILQNADGTPFLAPTTDEAKEVRNKVGTAHKLVSILDEVREIRDRVGGESKWGNSDDYQRLQVLKENLVLIRKAGTQGMSSDADMARLERMLGADNPASFRAQAAKLDEGRDQVIKQVNSDLHNQYGYTGKDIEWTDPLKAPKAPGDPALSTTLARPALRLWTPDDLIEHGVDPLEARSMTSTQRMRKGLELQRASGGTDISAQQSKAIDDWGSVLTNPKASEQSKTRARDFLAQAANTAQSKTVRSRALEVLAGSSVDVAPSPEQIVPAQGTARDTSKGGQAQTQSAQAEAEQMRANAMEQLSVPRLEQGALAQDDASKFELVRRANGGDKAAASALVRIVQAKK